MKPIFLISIAATVIFGFCYQSGRTPDRVVTNLITWLCNSSIILTVTVTMGIVVSIQSYKPPVTVSFVLAAWNFDWFF